ncbi:hypothetical protein LSTR_LSTR003575 [Laodelphax striatellus]|uniref:Protein kinase domain-containing protein n=1 Tax=Laodelphax striatellus TaxID=195883 RepID=A0A482WKV4_LAOST|nr:hypothetical protein LSTR_LSTR003575 [Laodelphax striatellus]
MALKDDTWVRRFIVSDPVKHKKGFTLYKITSIVFPKKHPEAVTKIIVWKRYNDFKKLHKELKLKYQKLQLPDKFPPFVKAKFFRRFEDDVIEERRQAALVLLDFVAQHSALFTSEAFVKFFQCGYSVNNTTGSIDKIEPCYNSLLQPWALEDPFHPAAIFSGPIKKDENAVTNSEDDITSFTTDTDSAISSPLQSEDIAWGVDDNSPIHRSNLQASSNSSQPTACKIFSASLEKELIADNGSCSYLQVDDFSTINQSGTSKNKELRKEISLAQLWRPIDELRFYKVLAVYTKVMLVIDTRKDSLHVIKGLQKSPYPMLKDRGTVFPGLIPYMVQLHAVVETASFVYLVMQHVSSGKLWDYVTPYFPKYAPKICTRNASPIDEDPKSISVSQHSANTVTNSASKTIHGSKSSSSASSIDDFEFNSYADLIKDYTSAKKVNLDEDNTDHKVPISHSVSCGDKLIEKGDKTVVPNSASRDDTASKDNSSLYEQILNYSKSENSALNTLINKDDPLYQISDDLALFNLVANRLETGKTSSELAEKWGKLKDESTSDSVKKDNDCVENKVDSVKISKIKSSKSNTKLNEVDNVNTSVESPISCSKESKFNCDLLTCDDSVPDVHTASLVENAKRLLKSVDETLSKSESLMVRVKQDIILKESKLDEDTSAILSSSSVSSSSSLNNIENIQEDASNAHDKYNVIVHAENVDVVRTATPDLTGSPSSLRHLKAFVEYDMTRLHPGSPYSRAGSPVSSVSTDPEAHWWKMEEEGRGLKEDTVRRWAAQLLVALSALHNLGVICRDLNPENLLVHKGSVKLTYFCQFAGIEPPVNHKAIEKLYCAPEVTSIFPVTQAADWWSFGAILYELITGHSLASCRNGGFHGHTILYIPEGVSSEAGSLLKQLLQFNASERLCCGADGVEEIKAHPFFAGIDWIEIHNEGLTVD